jgi:hypothetical protein
VEVRFFGEFEAPEGGVPVPVRGVKQRTVLALLALHRGQPVSADRLIDALWGDGKVANPGNALQAQIGQLRRTLGATAIVTSEAGYALGIDPGDVDAVRFEQLVTEERRLLEEGEMALASSALSEALRLRRGSRSPSSPGVGIILGLFAVLVTGKYPEGIRDLLGNFYRYALRVEATSASPRIATRLSVWTLETERGTPRFQHHHWLRLTNG